MTNNCLSRLSGLNILISGQALTSRTEAVEDYLSNKVKTLGVIAIANPYSPRGIASRRFYQRGKLCWEKPLHNLYFDKNRPPFMLIPVFIGHLFFILKAACEFRCRFDVFIGVSCFSAGLGLVLKALGIVKHTIYYSTDYYYRSSKKFGFNRLIVAAFQRLDKICAKKSDLVWHVTPRIGEGRQKFSGLPQNSYNAIHVPLCYEEALLSPQPLGKIKKNTLGFVGTLSANQGLQMVIRAMPELARQIPSIQIEIVGSGYFGDELRKMVASSSCPERFIFHGFVKDEKEVIQIISTTAIGLAVWTGDENDNTLYADPGKPKFYAFCGIPTIITKVPAIASEIERMNAGLAISYDEKELVKAVTDLLNDEEKLLRYREGALEFARGYTSKLIFSRAWRESLEIIYHD